MECGNVFQYQVPFWDCLAIAALFSLCHCAHGAHFAKNRINQPAGFVLAKIAPTLGAPVPVLIPRLVNFDVLMADTLKAPPYPVQLSNFGDASLTPGAVSMSGPSAADFTPSSACNTAIPGGGECVINVAFAYNTAPSGSPRSATMSVALGGLPSQTVALTASAGAPAIHMFEDQGINFLPVTTVDFGAVALGSQATINLSPFNQGSAPAILQQASLTGDFSATPVITTPLLLQPGGPPSAPVFIPHFSFAVTFKPTAAGARSGQFVLTEAALNGSHIVQLTGTGVTDFSLSADPDSNQVSVLQGGSAIATMHLSAAPGFTGSVSFSCSGLPAGAFCSASPASFSFSGAGGTQNISVTLSTTGSSAALPGVPFHRKPLNRNAGLWWWAAAPVFGLLLVAGRPNKGRVPRLRVMRGLLALALLVIGTLLVSCGGGSGTSHGPSGPTPPGTYSITVTVASGSTGRSAVVVLVVR
jgi:hypothetical protein